MVKANATVIGIIALLLTFGAWSWSQNTLPLRDGVVAVTLTDSGFEPANIRIRSGTEVTFKTTRSNQFWPASNLHPEHTLYPEFDPKRPLEPSESWTFTFEKPGTWGYHDHLRSYFTGTLYVDEY